MPSDRNTGGRGFEYYQDERYNQQLENARIANEKKAEAERQAILEAERQARQAAEEELARLRQAEAERQKQAQAPTPAPTPQAVAPQPQVPDYNRENEILMNTLKEQERIRQEEQNRVQAEKEQQAILEAERQKEQQAQIEGHNNMISAQNREKQNMAGFQGTGGNKYDPTGVGLNEVSGQRLPSIGQSLYSTLKPGSRNSAEEDDLLTALGG